MPLSKENLVPGAHLAIGTRSSSSRRLSRRQKISVPSVGDRTLVSCPRNTGILLRSKWAAGKAVRAGLAVGGSISEAIRDRRTTQPPAHFHRNPLGRGQLAVFPRCSLDPYHSDMGASLAP